MHASPARHLAALLGVGLLATLITTPALAASPARLTVVDLTKKSRDSKQPRKTTRSWLAGRDGVKVMPSAGMPRALRDAGVSFDGARKGLDNRRRSALSAVLTKRKLDGVVLLRVERRGRRLRLVLLDAEGKTVASRSRKLRRRRKTSTKQVRNMLSADVSTLLKARTARLDAARKTEKARPAKAAARTRTAEKDTTREGSSGKGDVKKVAPKPTASDTPAVLAKMVELDVGVLVAQRGVAFDSETVRVNNTIPFYGAALRANAGLALGEKGRLGFELRAGIGKGSIAATDDQVDDYDLSSTLTQLGGGVDYAHALSDSFALSFGLSGSTVKAAIEANPRYTGHRYTTASLNLGAMTLLGPVRLDLIGGPTALFAAETSGGVYGSGQFSAIAGYHLTARAAYTLTDMIQLYGAYEHNRLKAEYDVATTSSDEFLHFGSVGVRATF